MRLAGKAVIITGAGSGLGRESALLFAEEGAAIAVADLSTGRCEEVTELVRKSGGQAFACPMDVGVEEQVARAVDQVVEKFGKLDIMYANAGTAMPGRGSIPFEELSEAVFDEVSNVNFKGVFFSIKHAARVMKDTGGGSIIVTLSSAVFRAFPGWALYSAAKQGSRGLVQGAAVDLGRYGIRVNALCPQVGMSTNFLLPPDAQVTGQSHEESATATWDPRAYNMPLDIGRPPLLADNARVALFLASDESAYLSGAAIPVDGGALSQAPAPRG